MRAPVPKTAETAGHRAGADCRPGISAGTAGQRLHHHTPTQAALPRPPATRPPSLTSHTSPFQCEEHRSRAAGLKEFRGPDGQDLACRMLTIRQKTLIGFN